MRLAFDYAAEAALLDLEDFEHNTRDGLHLASLAGALLAFCSSTVSPNSFTFWSGVFLLVGSVVSLNGLSLPAALVGGAFITLVPTYLAQAGDWVPILYGVALIVVTLVANADGLLRVWPGRGRR